MIGQTISHYRIREKIGEGGMGVVYAAEDTHLGRQVAVKLLPPESNGHHYRSRFLREARAISALSHPNIATIYDGGETPDERPFIVMELVTGKTLSDLLQESELTLNEALDIIESVAEALEAAHEQGIVHRDIKPSNVMVNDKGQVKVLDFGLAKLINEDESPFASPEAQTLLATRTQSGVVVGTPLYLSPEQATGQPVDARSDLFTLGALLYECITGRAAFSGSSVLEIGAQVIHVNPERPSRVNEKVPEELDQVVMKALSKKAEQRYQTAEEMLKDLRAVHAALSDEDKLRTLSFSGAEKPRPQTSALMTLNYKLGRPMLSIRFVLLILLGVGLAALGYARWHRPALHKPSAEAERWYNIGTIALRDGAFFRGSKALEEAVKADDKYALAHARLAEAEMELGYAEQAKDELLKVGALIPDRSVLPQVDALYLSAINAVATRDFASAVAAYSQILSQTPDDAPNKAQVFVDLGRAYEKNGELPKAIESYIEATQRDPQYATAYLRLGMLYARKQDTASATIAFDKAEALFQTASNVEGKTQVLIYRGMLFRDSGRLAEAEDQLQLALDTSRANNSNTQQIFALLQLGRVYYSQGAMARAQQAAQEALDFAQQHGLESLVARGLTERGWAFFAVGDYEAAEKDFRQELEITRRKKLTYLEATGLFALGSVFIQQLRTDEGLTYVEQALDAFQNWNYRQDIALCLTYIGRGRRRKGDYAAAQKAFEQELKLSQEVNDQRQVAFSYDGIASVMLEQGRYPEAFENYDRSFSINRSLGDRLTKAYGLMNSGNALWRMGRYNEASASLERAVEMASQSEGRYPQVLAEVETIKAQIALSQRRFPEARAYSKKALDLAGTKYKELTVDAKYTLGMALVLSGAGGEGRPICEDALKSSMELGDAWRLSNAQMALAEARLETDDAQGAQALALEAQQRFSRAGQTEFEWRAWLIAGLAARRMGDENGAQERLAHARESLSQLQQKWGPEAFTLYLNRPDISLSQKKLGGV